MSGAVSDAHKLKGMEMVVTKERVETVTDLAVQLEVSRRTIQDWKKKPGFPVERDGSFIPSKVAEWRKRTFTERHDFKDRLRGNRVTDQVQTLLEELRELPDEMAKMLPEDYRQDCSRWFELSLEEAIRRAFDGGQWGLMYEKGELRATGQR